MAQLWFQAETERNRLLPPLCPRCSSTGTRALPIPTLGVSEESALVAYYCDRCADRLEREKTRHASRWASSALLGVGAATSSALALGGARLGLQITLTLSAALTPLLLARLVPNTDGPALYRLPSSSGPERFLAERRDYARELDPSLRSAAAPREAHFVQRQLLPVLVGLTWLAGLHWLGRAELRVMHGDATSDAVVLIDHRRRQSIGPTRGEHPHAGRAVTTLAGRRTLSLVSDAGEPVAQVTATLWPGRDYLFGALPKDRCLFLESQEYGARGRAHDLALIPGSGPLWELPTNVDLWFSPLSQRPEFATSGGVRTAIRLLPCP